MRKTKIAALIGLAFSANALGADDLNISGFGSIAVGMSDNDIGYARYDSENYNVEQDTVVGLQFDFQVNDKASISTQLVANGRYDFEPTIETTYLSYEFDYFTMRGGKLHLPMFMYSDYYDVAYAYPMLRPSQETYEQLVVTNFIGGDFLIPFDIGETTVQFQPFFGQSKIESRNSRWGEVDLKDILGINANWYIGDLTLRAAYIQFETGFDSDQISDAATATYIEGLLEDKKGTFGALGMQYDNGSFMFSTEAIIENLEGRYFDSQSISAISGYRFGSFMPYIAVGWAKSSDDDERPAPSISSVVDATTGAQYGAAQYENALFNFERISYSIGSRWDFADNIALKLDVTYVDYKETSGYFASNLEYGPTLGPNTEIATGSFKEDSSIVYSAAIDFVF